MVLMINVYYVKIVIILNNKYNSKNMKSFQKLLLMNSNKFLIFLSLNSFLSFIDRKSFLSFWLIFDIALFIFPLDFLIYK